MPSLESTMDNDMLPSVKEDGNVSIAKKERLSNDSVLALKKEFSADEQAQFILEQMEDGALNTFDHKTVELLQNVMTDDNKKTLFSYFAAPVKWISEKIAPSVAGAVSATAGSRIGQHIVTDMIRNSLLSEYIIKAAPTLSKATIDQGMNLPFEASGASSILTRAAENIGEALRVGIGTVTEGAKSHAINPLVEGVNATSQGAVEIANQQVEGLVNHLAQAAGYSAKIPSGAVGWLGGSALMGGIIGVIKERYKEGSFERIADTLTRSTTMIQYRELQRRQINGGGSSPQTIKNNSNNVH